MSIQKTEWTKEWGQSRKELADSQRELCESQKETGRQIQELGKKLSRLGDKFGSVTEGLALPSMTEILTRDFNMSVIAPRVRVRDNGYFMELDVLAWSKAPAGDAVVVEVKSHLREDGLEQIRKILRDFREFFPEHAHRKVYGILAAVDVPDDLREKVLREGIYLARIHDGQFELQVPESFQARAF